MKSQLLINNKTIFYSDQGKGKVIVLLHGYLESLNIWDDFAKKLANKYRVICFDIPGHGDSKILSEKHSMELLAEMIYKSLSSLSVEKCFMIGHSMGGYLTLMFHQLYPEMLSAFCLFHSHPFADADQTINNRLREIKLVQEGKKELIAKFNIPNAFATDHLELFKQEILNAIEIALQTPEEGIIANLHAMMKRPDLSESLAKSEIPFLYIAGKKDNYIDFNTVIPKINLPKDSELVILENSGHSGFIEETKKSVNIIHQFILKHL